MAGGHSQPRPSSARAPKVFARELSSAPLALSPARARTPLKNITPALAVLGRRRRLRTLPVPHTKRNTGPLHTRCDHLMRESIRVLAFVQAIIQQSIDDL